MLNLLTLSLSLVFVGFCVFLLFFYIQHYFHKPRKLQDFLDGFSVPFVLVGHRGAGTRNHMGENTPSSFLAAIKNSFFFMNLMSA